MVDQSNKAEKWLIKNHGDSFFYHHTLNKDTLQCTNCFEEFDRNNKKIKDVVKCPGCGLNLSVRKSFTTYATFYYSYNKKAYVTQVTTQQGTTQLTTTLVGYISKDKLYSRYLGNNFSELMFAPWEKYSEWKEVKKGGVIDWNLGGLISRKSIWNTGKILTPKSDLNERRRQEYIKIIKKRQYKKLVSKNKWIDKETAEIIYNQVGELSDLDINNTDMFEVEKIAKTYPDFLRVFIYDNINILDYNRNQRNFMNQHTWTFNHNIGNLDMVRNYDVQDYESFCKLDKKIALQKADKNIIKQRKKLLNLNLETKTYKIIPPRHSKEMKRESDVMHNCVRTYNERIKDNEHIFYVRTKTNRSIATLEIRNNEVRQLRTFHNKNVPARLEKEIYEWVETEYPKAFE